MEPNNMSGGIYSNIQPGMLGLEMSLHHPIPPQNPTHNMPHPHQPVAAFGHHEADYHSRTQQSAKQGIQFASKSKYQSLTLSDEDEPGFTAETSADDGKKKMSPWQRMKWTDKMVRLLIMVVYYIGDEVSSDQGNNDGKKKSGGVLQKKGKWKSVSRAMTERGFNVSPQQCEDKFNDLNKRYKRVNDILGKGTSCRVVENQSLLDSMDHISPKMKEEVKKLLNSKHLFFREMCAYHNSCAHGSGSGGAQNLSPEVAAEPQPPPQAAAQQQRCLHLPDNVAQAVPNLNRADNEGSKLEKGTSSEEDDDDEDDDEDGDDDDEDEEDHEINDQRSRKRMRKGGPALQSQIIEELNGEMMNVLGDGTKSHLEKRQWMKAKLMRLEEQRVGIQSQSFELEKQRLKWLKFSTKKEREMEREKLTNERLKLENERMVLIIRQKEIDFLDHQLQHQHQQQHSSNKKSPSSITG